VVPNDAKRHDMSGSGRKRSLKVQNQIKRRIGHFDVPGRGNRLRGPYQVRALRALWKAAEAELARPARFRGQANYTDKSSGKNLGLVDWTLSKVQDLKLEQAALTSQNLEPSRPMPEIVGAIVEIVTSSTAPALTAPVPASTQGEPASYATPKLDDSGSGDRSLITSTKLQSAITEAVKKSVPGCEAFVGVIVQRTTPKSRFDANWALRGVKFGRADRDSADEAVKAIVKRMQREFHISDD
jgi:hypothetical protein